MLTDILIGNRKNNIIRRLKDSWIAKGLLFISWMYLYEVFGKSNRLSMSMILFIGFLGVLTVNIFYVPGRLLEHRKAGGFLKIMLILVTGAVTGYGWINIKESHVESIIGVFFQCIMIEFALIIVVLVLNNFWKVHAKNNRKYRGNCSIDEMEGHEFEYYCADLLKRRGFQRVEVTQGSGDYGIDIIAWKNGMKYGIQCKRYSGAVGWHAVEEAHAGAVYYDCDRAVVVTNSNFTRQALEGAEKIGVELWKRDWFEQRS